MSQCLVSHCKHFSTNHCVTVTITFIIYCLILRPSVVCPSVMSVRPLHRAEYSCVSVCPLFLCPINNGLRRQMLPDSDKLLGHPLTRTNGHTAGHTDGHIIRLISKHDS